jgi:hypothetical protein
VNTPNFKVGGNLLANIISYQKENSYQLSILEFFEWVDFGENGEF